ncbi:MAG: Nramp family divalent metal transporter, partial [Aeoliella sp.]
IERFSLFLLAGFTLMTLASVIALQWTEFAFTSTDVIHGLQGHLPVGAILVVFGAFGLTGVGGDEIMQYTYWLLEKGYASYTGKSAHADADWQRRARGWIRVMYADAILSMVAYTVVTTAFYILGATVLYRKGIQPAGYELISTLATMYTESLGPWAQGLFLFGAFVVLFSTLFSALAAWTRIFADAFGKLGWIDFSNDVSRGRAIVILAWLFPTSWATIFLVYEQPVLMILLGGVATSILLLLVVYAAIAFRRRESIYGVGPGPIYDTALCISSIAICLFALFGALRAFGHA